METLIFLFDNLSLMGIFISFASFFIGLKYPDWDFKLKLRHRSFLTHTPLILLIFIKLYQENNNDMFRFFIIGFALALSLHYTFDYFPKGWSGGALIKIPLFNMRCTPFQSKVILLSSSLIALLITILFTKNIIEFYYFLLLGVLTLVINVKKEKKLFRPLLCYIIFSLFIGCIKYENLLQNIKIFLYYLEIIIKNIRDYLIVIDN